MDPTKAGDYARRLKQIVDCRDKHLDEPLSVEQLCQVAHLPRTAA